MIFSALAGFGSGIAFTLVWSLVADSVDFGDLSRYSTIWKNGEGP